MTHSSRLPFIDKLRRVWPFIGASKLALAILVIAAVVGGLAEAVLLATLVQIATAMSAHTDRVVTNLGPLPTLTARVPTLFAIAAGATAVRLALQVVSAYMPARVSTRVLARLRDDLFAHFVRASWETQSKERDGDLLQVLTGHVGRAAQATLAVANGLAAALNFAALVGSALFFNLTGALVLMVAAGALFFLLRPLSKLARRSSRELAAATVALGQVISESVQVAEEMHVYGVGDARRAEVAALNRRMARPYFRSQMLQRLLGAAYQGLALSVVVAGLGLLYALEVEDVAGLGAVVLLLVRALSYSQGVQSAYHTANETAPYIGSVDRALQKYAGAQTTAGIEPLDAIDSVEFRDVGYSYVPGRPVLEHVSFAVRRGETVGVIGPSGAGKSTFVQLLLGLRRPREGVIEVNGRDYARFRSEDWHRLISYVPQDPKLIHGTVADNIRFMRDVSAQGVRAAAEAAYIHDEIERFAGGYERLVGQRADAVSGGQRQRIALARALALNPALLVLDEPTSALDPQSEALVQGTLMALKGHVTVFIVAHRLSTLSICDRLMVFSDGRLEAFGETDALMRDNEFYQRALEISQQ